MIEDPGGDFRRRLGADRARAVEVPHVRRDPHVALEDRGGPERAAFVFALVEDGLQDVIDEIVVAVEQHAAVQDAEGLACGRHDRGRALEHQAGRDL